MNISFKAIKIALIAIGIMAFTTTAQAAYTDDCITFSSTASFTLKTNNGTKNWDGTLWISTDKTTWTEWKGVSVSAVQTGDTYNLYVRGDTNNTKITGYDEDYRWVLAGNNIACTGNIETLRGATGEQPSPTSMADYCYTSMFQDCAALIKAPALSATTLASFCYHSMFQGCTALTTAPELPALMLAYRCYCIMFQGCTALTAAPKLLAMELAIGCYAGMFDGCTALANAPALPATTLAEDCYAGTFQSCTALTVAPALPATTLARNCCNSMFEGCTSLTNAPALPATTLATQCYYEMFSGCTSLTEAPTLSATTLAEVCCYRMFRGCTALTTAPALPATTLAINCYDEMFQGCTALKAAPALPATNLASYCYFVMFSGCTALTDAPELPATKLAECCYTGMFSGCTSLEVNTMAPGKEWKIPATITPSYWGDNMFRDTKGTLQGIPKLNTTYYIASVPPGSKDFPWPIGAGEDDTVNAWTNGTTLVVQGAGNMKEFAADGSDIPWPASEISAVEISVDVTGIGYNVWYGLDDSVTYNGLSIGAAKTLINGFKCKPGLLMMIK